MSSSPEYYNINQGTSSLSFSTIYTTSALIPDKKNEGFADMSGLISAYNAVLYDGTNPDTSENAIYDYDANGKILVYPPHHPLYVPTLQDTHMQDELTLLSQNNVMFALSAIAGVSVLILGVLISRSSST
jgi:hypothetical protein